MSLIADKLDEARALIERGWTQHANRCGDNYCALGALGVVRGEQALPLLRQAICHPLVADWNDVPGRTQAEVVEAFRKAAELARAEQVQS